MLAAASTFERQLLQQEAAGPIRHMLGLSAKFPSTKSDSLVAVTWAGAEWPAAN
jgi:hypothetical protein